MPTLRLGIDARGARSGAREFNRAAGTVTKSAKSAGTAVRGLVGAIGAGVAIRQVARIIGKFEESIVTLGAVARASESQLEDLTNTARTLGATTRFSALEASEGLTFLARAGFDADESMAAIGATLNLAQVGMIDLGKAADIASNVVSQFSLDADRTVEVVDALVIVSNRANTNILQLSEALKFAGPIAGAFGNTVEQTSAALGVLGDRGIQGTLAGTGLRTALLKLADPTERARDTIHDLGLTIESLSPETNDIITIFGRLGAAQAKASDLGRIFGARTAATAIILSQSVDRVRELEEATEAYAGEAKEIADLQDDTLVGSFKALTSAATELVLALGDGGLGGAFRSVTVVATDTLRVLSGIEVEGQEASAAAAVLATSIKFAAGALAAFAAIRAGTFLLGLTRSLIAATAATNGLSVATGAATRVSALGRAFAALSSPAGLVITAAGLAAAAFVDMGTEAEKLEKTLEGVGAGVSDLDDALQRLAENRAAVAQAAELGDTEGVVKGIAADIGILNDQAEKLRLQIEKLGESGATTDIAKALGLGLEQSDIDFLAGAARLEVRNAFADAAADDLITPAEAQGLRKTLRAAFDDEGGVFGADIDAFIEGLTRARGISSGMGVGGLVLPDLDPDEILNQFESRFDLARVRTTGILDLINDRIRSLGEVAGDAGGEVEEALGTNVVDRLQEVRDAIADIDLEGALTDPSARLKSATDQLSDALQAAGVDLSSVRSEASTLARALEILGDAEEKLVSKQEDGRQSLAAVNAGLLEEREEVGLNAAALNKLRLERQLTAIEQQGEIEISAEAREGMLALRQEIDSGRVVQEQADQAAQSLVSSLADYASGASTAKDAARAFFQALQQQLLQQFALQPLTALISGGIQSGVGALSGAFSTPGNVFGSAKGNAFDTSGQKVGQLQSGGILDRPGIAQLANGALTTFAEKEPEGILPLRRGRGGRLGVEVAGGAGGGTTITNNTTIITPDADSFRKSGRQAAAQARRTARL